MKSSFRSIVITGAGSGIGASLAELFAGTGINLGLIGRDRSRLDNITGKCRQAGANVETISLDVRNREALEQWLADFDDKHAIDLVIASAGITKALPRSVLHESDSELIDIMNTNYIGVLNTIFPVIDRMQARMNGHVAVISSLSAYHGIPGFPAYSSSKAALLNYLQGIRGRLAASGINLTVICPGYVDTPMTAKLPGIKMMVMPAAKAAGIIKRGLERRKPLIAFPLLLRLGLWLLGILPVRLTTYILNKLFGLKKREGAGVRS